jgi:hypothetical protein
MPGCRKSSQSQGLRRVPQAQAACFLRRAQMGYGRGPWFFACVSDFYRYIAQYSENRYTALDFARDRLRPLGRTLLMRVGATLKSPALRHGFRVPLRGPGMTKVLMAFWHTQPLEIFRATQPFVIPGPRSGTRNPCLEGREQNWRRIECNFTLTIKSTGLNFQAISSEVATVQGLSFR